MGPTGTSRKRQIITAAAVLVAIVLIVSATVVAAKKKQTTSSTTATTDTTSQATTSDDDNGLRGDGTTDDTTASTTTTATTTASSFKDGSYTATTSYESPGGTEGLTVKLTLKDGVVTDSTVTSDPTEPEAREYQDQFISGYKSLVVGKAIDAIKLSRVSGSSLTSQGFNNAVAKIKTQAQA